MNPGEIIALVLKASIVLTVLAFALDTRLRDATSLLRAPARLARAVVSMNVVMPAVAAVLAAAFDLHPAIKIAMVALAVSPVPPLLPGKAFKAGGEASYTIGLLTAASILAILFVPLSLELLQRIFGVPMGMPASAVALAVLTTVLGPLAAGMVIQAVLPGMATRIAKPVSLIATVMLICGALPILVAAWPAIRSLIGKGDIVALAAFVAVGLVTGHLLGGPDPEERMVLALSTASRHPGVAIAIAHTSFPQQKLALAAVLLYLLVSAVVSIPYLKWKK